MAHQAQHPQQQARHSLPQYPVNQAEGSAQGEFKPGQGNGLSWRGGQPPHPPTGTHHSGQPHQECEEDCAAHQHTCRLRFHTDWDCWCRGMHNRHSSLHPRTSYAANGSDQISSQAHPTADWVCHKAGRDGPSLPALAYRRRPALAGVTSGLEHSLQPSLSGFTRSQWI